MATASGKRTEPMEERALQKKRRQGNLWIAGYFLGIAVIYRFSDDLVYWIKCWEAGRVLTLEDAAVGDVGAEAYQGLFLKLAYLLFGIGISAILAGFMKERIQEGGAGPFSRWFACFALFLLCYSLLGA